jgi:hypothetical protein
LNLISLIGIQDVTKSLLQVYTMRPFQGQSLAYGFASGVFGCKATGNGDEDLGAVTICPDAPMTTNGPVIDWMAPQVRSSRLMDKKICGSFIPTIHLH